MSELSAMVLLDKPFGATSFQAAHRLKKILGVKKTGHCGTLDPAATGLLLVLTGKATKLQDKFMKKDKVYLSSFALGTSTDSGDAQGKIVSQKDFSKITRACIEKALDNFRGEILQVPPMFSALKYKGAKLYELARKGLEVERKPRKIEIKKAEILSYKDGILEIRIHCSSGTYIRSIAGDLGKVLGCGAHVCALRREKIGDFDVKDALNFDVLQNFDAQKENFKKSVIDYEKLVEL